MKKLNIEEVRARGLEKGYVLKSTSYNNCMEKLDWECIAGSHSYPSSFNNIDRDKGCPKCYGNAKPTIEEVKSRALKKGFYLNSDIYINAHTLLDLSCVAEWHHIKVIFNSIDQDQGCPICAGNQRLDLEYVRRVGLEKGFYLNSDTYINNHTLMDWSCIEEWHPFPMSYGSIREERGCPKCNYRNRQWENSVYAQLVCIFPNLEQNKIGLLKSKRSELDIFDRVNLKAVELDGPTHYKIMWYDKGSSKRLKKQQKSDLRKNQECLDAGIQLLRVKYSEYMKDPEGSLAKIVQFLS